MIKVYDRAYNNNNNRNSLAVDEDMSAPINHWLSLSGLPAGDVLPVGSQRVLDSV